MAKAAFWTKAQSLVLFSKGAVFLGPTCITVVGFKLSRNFEFFFDIINVKVTILDAKGLIK